MRLDRYMAQNKATTMKPGPIMKSTNVIGLCCQSFARFAKQTSSGHLTTSSSAITGTTTPLAFTVLFDTKGGAQDIVGVKKCKENELR